MGGVQMLLVMVSWINLAAACLFCPFKKSLVVFLPIVVANVSGHKQLPNY